MATSEEKRWAKEARSRRQALKKAAPPSSTNLFQARIRRTEFNNRSRSSVWIWFFLFAGAGLATGAWWLQRNTSHDKLIPATVSAPQPDLSATLQASSAPVVAPVAVSVAPVVAAQVTSVVEPSTAAPHAIVPDDRQWHAPTSGITDARHVIVKSRGVWHALWEEMAQSDQVPRINFYDHWVVGVFLGPKVGTGYEVQVAPSQEMEKEVVIPYRVIEPLPGVPLSSDTVHPWQLRVIARTDKPIHFVDESSAHPGVSH